MDGVIIQLSGVQISNKSDWTKKVWWPTDRDRGPGGVLKCISSFSLFCSGVSRWWRKAWRDRQIYKLVKKVMSVDSHMNIRVKLTSEITLMVTCGRRMGSKSRRRQTPVLSDFTSGNRQYYLIISHLALIIRIVLNTRLKPKLSDPVFISIIHHQQVWTDHWVIPYLITRDAA